MRSLAVLAKEALDIQNACNGLGLTKGMARAIQDLREALDEAKQPSDTDSLNYHPIFRLWASKLHDLAGLGISNNNYDVAYSACETLAYTWY